MTKKLHHTYIRHAIGLLGVVLWISSTAFAQSTYYWNPTTGGSGTWDTTTTMWSTTPVGPLDTVWNNTNNDSAIFRGGITGDITVDAGGISVQNIFIGATGEAENLYSFSVGTITLSGTVPNIIGVTNSTDTAIVNSVLSGTNLFFNNTTGPAWLGGQSQSMGNGNLILTANNNLSGTVNVGGYNQGSGAFRITNSGALGTATVEVNGQFCTTHLDLDGSGGDLTISNTIILHGRGTPHGSNLTPELVNVAGNNTINSGFQIMSGGYDFLIQSDSGKLTINSGITNNSGNMNSRYLYLQGARDGEVTGPIGINGTGIGTFYLIKAGLGTWTLSGANVYAGSTTIMGGTLKLAATGSIANSPLIDVNTGVFDVSAYSSYTLDSGKTLRGNGTVLGTVLVQGWVVPGESPGMLTVGNMTFDAGSMLDIELAGDSPGSFDVLNSTGSLTLQSGSTFTVSLISGYVTSGGETFDIMNFDNLSGTFTTLNLPTLSGGLIWGLDDLYTNGTITVIPEPTIILLLATGALMLLLRRRR